jgi:hypothetical protein
MVTDVQAILIAIGLFIALNLAVQLFSRFLRK